MCHQFEGQKSDSVLIHYLKKDMKKNSHICLEKNFEREWFSGHLDLERKKRFNNINIKLLHQQLWSLKLKPTATESSSLLCFLHVIKTCGSQHFSEEENNQAHLYSERLVSLQEGEIREIN